MKKIPTIFKRNPGNMKEITPEPNSSCAWVFSGEGIATRKYDGTCCRIEGGKLFKRRELKKDIPVPPDFVQADCDDTTGKIFGWIPVDPSNATDKWHISAFIPGMADGTYELLGPKIQGNPEGLTTHMLLLHSDADILDDVPRTFNGLREWFKSRNIEGIVFHHPDGRMAKIKKRDFGLARHCISTGD